MLLGPPAHGAKKCKEAECGDIQIGRPKLWSLSDAQYLVGQALQKLRDLRVKLPENGELDPNKTHGRELDVVRQFIGVSAEFDQTIQTKNRLEMERYGEERKDVSAARERIWQIDAELATLRAEKVAVDARVAAIVAEEQALTAWITEIDQDITRLGDQQGGGGDAPPDDPPPDETTTTEDSSLSADDRSRLDRLQDQRAELLEQKFKLASESGKARGDQAALDSHIASLSAERATLAETSASAPTLSTPDPTISDEHKALLEAMLEKEGVKEALASRLTKILDGEASLHYVHELDNLVDAQLQVISRRLSLLRQSVDPNYDLYFMETTASLTPTRQARRHVARARWRVSADDIDYDSILELYTRPRTVAGAWDAQPSEEIRFGDTATDRPPRTVPRRDAANRPGGMNIKTQPVTHGAFGQAKGRPARKNSKSGPGRPDEGIDRRHHEGRRAPPAEQTMRGHGDAS